MALWLGASRDYVLAMRRQRMMQVAGNQKLGRQ